MAQQLFNGNVAPSRRRCWKILRHTVVQGNLALFHKDHDSRSREWLREGCEFENGVLRSGRRHLDIRQAVAVDNSTFPPRTTQIDIPGIRLDANSALRKESASFAAVTLLLATTWALGRLTGTNRRAAIDSIRTDRLIPKILPQQLATYAKLPLDGSSSKSVRWSPAGNGTHPRAVRELSHTYGIRRLAGRLRASWSKGSLANAVVSIWQFTRVSTLRWPTFRGLCALLRGTSTVCRLLDQVPGSWFGGESPANQSDGRPSTLVHANDGRLSTNLC